MMPVTIIIVIIVVIVIMAAAIAVTYVDPQGPAAHIPAGIGDFNAKNHPVECATAEVDRHVVAADRHTGISADGPVIRNGTRHLRNVIGDRTIRPANFLRTPDPACIQSADQNRATQRIAAAAGIDGCNTDITRLGAGREIHRDRVPVVSYDHCTRRHGPHIRACSRIRRNRVHDPGLTARYDPRADQVTGFAWRSSTPASSIVAILNRDRGAGRCGASVRIGKTVCDHGIPYPGHCRIKGAVTHAGSAISSSNR